MPGSNRGARAQGRAISIAPGMATPPQDRWPFATPASTSLTLPDGPTPQGSRIPGICAVVRNRGKWPGISRGRREAESHLQPGATGNRVGGCSQPPGKPNKGPQQVGFFRPRCSAKRPIKEGRFPNRPQRRFVNRRSLARKLTALCLISMLQCTRRFEVEDFAKQIPLHRSADGNRARDHHQSGDRRGNLPNPVAFAPLSDCR